MTLYNNISKILKHLTYNSKQLIINNVSFFLSLIFLNSLILIFRFLCRPNSNKVESLAALMVKNKPKGVNINADNHMPNGMLSTPCMALFSPVIEDI